MDRIGLSNHSTNRGGVNPGARDAASATGRTGSYRGERVRALPIAPSPIASAEELAKAIYERFGTDDKELDERKVDAEPRRRGMSAEQIAIYLQESHAGDDSEKLEKTLDQILSGQISPKHVAKQFSQDVTQQSVVLQHALHRGQSEGVALETVELIENAIADLLAEQGAAVQAGLNICRAASEIAQDLSGVERFQSAYRDIVIGATSLAGTLKILLERLDSQTGAAFSTVINSMMKALGDDLAALRSSVDKRRLQILISDLSDLKVMTTILEQCIELCATLRARHGLSAPEASPCPPEASRCR